MKCGSQGIAYAKIVHILSRITNLSARGVKQIDWSYPGREAQTIVEKKLMRPDTGTKKIPMMLVVPVKVSLIAIIKTVRKDIVDAQKFWHGACVFKLVVACLLGG